MKTAHRLVSLLLFMLLALLVALPFAVAFAQAPAKAGKPVAHASAAQLWARTTGLHGNR
ncbi:hypothetical protein [Hymenobacter latericus]|uniref:hypothetical protein n=1 Tax=Hymenobacter sp. YIM 151858-1 TaxID=2987688 RepID=UPI0022279576|nr:hypothetical protein [Hymenobacter sp. YIM 151858-1]UYZ59600.1 hypothetical protein OIS50_02105 [Hymenobacter sp. YIM 151858-1]